MTSDTIPLEKKDACRYEVPRSFDAGMRVPGKIFASEKLLKEILKDKAIEQVVNVAHLPGIVGFSMAMPDMHWGYGFPIGGGAGPHPHPGGASFPRVHGVSLN